MPLFCRWRSFRIASATSGSASASVRSIGLVVCVVMCSSPRHVNALREWRRTVSGPPFFCRYLIEPPLMASAFKRGLEPHLQDFVGKSKGDDPPAHGED